MYANNSEKYDKFIKTADSIWQEWTGAKNNLLVKPRITPAKSQIFCSAPWIKNPSKTTKKKTPQNSVDVANSLVFERLSQPILRKPKPSSANFIPGIFYDNRLLLNSELPKQLIQVTDTSEHKRKNSFTKIEDITNNIIRKIMRSKSSLNVKDVIMNRTNNVYRTRLLNYFIT